MAPVEPLRDCPVIGLGHAAFVISNLLVQFWSTSHSLPVLNLQGFYYSNPLSLFERSNVSWPVLRVRIRDTGSGAFLTPGSGIRDGWKVRILDPGWTTRILFPRACIPFFGLKYLNSYMRIRDPGWKRFGSGIRDGKRSDPGSGNIPDPQHCPWPLAWRLGSAVLLVGPVCLCHRCDPDHILVVFHLNFTHPEMPVMILSFRAHY